MLWLIRTRQNPELIQLLEEAEKLAGSYGHDYIGVEHVFLTFQNLPSSHVIPQTLASTGIDVSAFYEELEREARVPVDRKAPDKLPHTPRLKNILESCRQIPRLNKHPEVTTFHLFYAIAYEGDSLPTRILRKHFTTHNPQFGIHHINASILATYLLIPGRPTTWKMPKI